MPPPSNFMETRQQAHRLPSCFHGLSHGLKSVPRTLFASLHSAVLSSPSRPEGEINERIPLAGILSFIWYTSTFYNRTVYLFQAYSFSCFLIIERYDQFVVVEIYGVYKNVNQSLFVFLRF